MIALPDLSQKVELLLLSSIFSPDWRICPVEERCIYILRI